MKTPPSTASSGFTMVELLNVVLIIAILATIAVPSLLGQQLQAKHLGAQTESRKAITAAIGHAQEFNTFSAFDNVKLNTDDRSLANTPPTVLRAGDGADPKKFKINQVASGKGVQLCNASRGKLVYCVTWLDSRVYYHVTSGTIDQTAGTGGSTRSWQDVARNCGTDPTRRPAWCGSTLGDDNIGGLGVAAGSPDFVNAPSINANPSRPPCNAWTTSTVMNMCGNGTQGISRTSNTPVAFLRIEFAATQCLAGFPRATVQIDGTTVLARDITTEGANNFAWYEASFATRPAGPHTITVTYTNDNGGPGCDRNLYVRGLQLFQSGR